MPSLIAFYWLPLLIAFAIGLVTAWWTWGRATADDPWADDAPARPAPPPSLPDARLTPDDLMLIHGIGPQLDTLLRSLGITRFEQIAGWTEGDIDMVDAQLGPFQGSVRRDQWVKQAQLLAAGDVVGLETRYGNTATD